MARRSTSKADTLRARELVEAIRNASPEQLQRMAELVRAHNNKRRWQKLTQRRCTDIAAAIRAVQTRLQAPTRNKTATGWEFHGTRDDGKRVLAAILTAPLPRTFADFDTPVDVHIRDPRALDRVAVAVQLQYLDGVVVR